MTLTGITLHHYREAHTVPESREKWSWAHSILFILVTCGLFWAGAIALALRFF